MPKALWSDLLARSPGPHLLAAVLPDATKEQSLSNGQSAQRLMMRLLNKLRLRGDYAVTISRRNKQREILCAFTDADDVSNVARTIGASEAINREGSAGRYTFALDTATELKLVTLAGPPEAHRSPRTTPYQRWQS